jgi:general secretion pathway protein L
MPRYLGIDIGNATVRAAVLRTSYRKVALEGWGACDLVDAESLPHAIRLAVGGLATKCDGVAVSIGGESLFVRALDLPATAQRQLAQVVPFEVEAQLPFDIDEAVFDWRTLPRARGDARLPVQVVAARTADVAERIALITEAIGVEPQQVIPGSFSLAALTGIVPELAASANGPSPIALVDLGAVQTELVLLSGADVPFARTLSAGTQGLPASAAVLARELRQSFAAWRAGGGAAVEQIWLVGGGASASGADVFLAGELGMQVAHLPAPTMEGMVAEQAEYAPRFAKAFALAMSLTNRQRVLDLRRGSLAYERGYGFLRDKVPLLAGLSAVIVVSFLFSTWAELRSLGKEQEMLETTLAEVTKEVLGESTTDSARAVELLDQGPTATDEDPMPKVDAFDVLAQITEALPPDLKHDIEELDVQKTGTTSPPHVTLHGVVPKVQDAEDLAQALKTYRCFQDIKVIKTSQQIGGEGQKYHMEWEVKCPDDKKSKAAGASSASPAGGSK